MYWLTRYAKLLDLTQDMLADQMQMSHFDIREAMCNPNAELGRFVSAVEKLRERFEAPLRGNHCSAPKELNPFPTRTKWHEAYGTPAPTVVWKRVRRRRSAR